MSVLLLNGVILQAASHIVETWRRREALSPKDQKDLKDQKDQKDQIRTASQVERGRV
jgi:cell division protein FtsL